VVELRLHGAYEKARHRSTTWDGLVTKRKEGFVMAIRILGISGSPIPSGNTFQCLNETLNYARENLGVVTEIVNLAQMEIAECNGCWRCWTEDSVDIGCPGFDDDMNLVYPKVASADGFLFATPTYFGSVTGLMKVFYDRFVPFYDSPDSKNKFRGTIRFKPASGIVLAEKRNDGIETALATLHRCFLYNDLIIISAAAPSKYGISPTSSNLGGMLITENQPDVITKDESGMNSAKVVVRKVVEMAELMIRARG
jgi:multimeric flavodoxin WrbA